MKRIIFVLIVAILAFDIGLVWYLTNPNDAQYKSYYMENAAFEALLNNDIDTYFKYMDNPVSIKFHYGSSFILANKYAETGRYDDALRVLNSFEYDRNYSFCAQYKTAMRFACRLSDMVSNVIYPAEYSFDKNIYSANIYFKIGDYEKAIEFDKARSRNNSCFSAQLYAEAGDLKKAEEFLQQCKSTNRHLTAGIIAMKNKDYKTAEKYYLKAINPNCIRLARCSANNSAYLHLAELYKKTGNCAKSVEYAKKVLKISPYNYKAQQYVYGKEE